jgi:hypothetical protein
MRRDTSGMAVAPAERLVIAHEAEAVTKGSHHVSDPAIVQAGSHSRGAGEPFSVLGRSNV